MTTIIKFWRAESAMLASIVIALAGAITLPGSWEKVLGALLPLIAGGAVRQTVWAPDTHAAAIQAAAASVAAQLTPDGPADPPTPPSSPST
jgi:hypothetical protein